MKKSNLSTKIILMVEAILLISSILFCAVSIYRERVAIRKAIQQRMLDIANCASGSVNGDILGALEKDDKGSDAYNTIYNILAVFRDNVESEYVYSIREEGEGQFVFTVDTDIETPGEFGESVKYTDALATAAKGTAAVDEVPYSDAWGEFYSAYSPVFDSKGKVAGIIAVDFSAEWFEEQLSAQMRSTVLSYLVILLVTLLVAFLLAFSTVRPFVKMQGELLEEKVRAESANLAKSDFLANMSHEIRTPINAVLGMNEMILREGRKTQELKDGCSQAVKESIKNIVIYAGDVENAGHNLLAIVNDILDFSKIEAGKMDLVNAPYQLSSVLGDLSNMFHLKAQDKKLDFVIDVDRSLPDELSGDEVRVRQILTNILNNAVKYTEHGRVSLTLRGDKKGDGTIVLMAKISDTGIGIKQEDVDKLFTKFERLEMERNSTVEGTGLGLTITQRLLEMMGGSINVESEYGKGSTFTIGIPQRILSEAPMGDFQARFEANVLNTTAYHESFRAPKAHILIVDDTRINLTVVTNLLKSTCMQIDTVTSGAESVEMARDNYYDLILMDQRMPQMDGTEALHRIRATENGKSSQVPIICLTADAVIGARDRYLAEGFSDYLTKPVDSFALEKMLMKYLPDDKLERIREEKKEDVSKDTDKTGSKDFEILRAGGIDTETGLKYSQNDEEFYRSLLAEYASGEKEKIDILTKCYETSDWQNYMIHVHSLKSSSKTIGVMDLFEQAARLEAAANATDAATIHNEHAAMIERYKAVNQTIRSVISETDMSNDDSEILEFWPE